MSHQCRVGHIGTRPAHDSGAPGDASFEDVAMRLAVATLIGIAAAPCFNAAYLGAHGHSVARLRAR